MTTQVNSQTQITTEQHIAAARARWAETQAQQAAEQAAIEEQNAAVAARLHQELLARLAEHLPAWLLDYVQPHTDLDPDTATEFVTILPPGCAPIEIHYDMVYDKMLNYAVHTPTRLAYDEGNWWVRIYAHRLDDFDAVIDLAAAWGDEYAAMRAEADRRNAAGEVPQLEPPQPDPIDQAVTLLGKFSRGEQVTEFGAAIERSAAVVLAAVGIAIAHHLSRLADAMEARCD